MASTRRLKRAFTSRHSLEMARAVPAVFSVAIYSTLMFCLIALYLHWSPFASRREYEGLLRFMLPAQSASRDRLPEVFHAYCESADLVAMREAVQGS